MPTLSKPILTQLSTQILHINQGEDQFEVIVTNMGDRFATFAVELSAPGVKRNTAHDWYHLTPDLSVKLPVGDQARFIVTLLDLPPVSDGFTGKMNLSVHVTCVELGEDDRQSITLVVDGSGVAPPLLSLPKVNFEATPGDLIDIAMRLENPNRNTANIQLLLKGLPQSWLVDGYKRRVQLASHEHCEVLFFCQVPSSGEAINQSYPFAIEASQAQSDPISQTATLNVLPKGSLQFSCTVTDSDERDKGDGDRGDGDRGDGDLTSHRSEAAESPQTIHYKLTLDNASNVNQTVAMGLTRMDVPWFKRLWAMVRRQRPQPARTTRHSLHLRPAQVALKAGGLESMLLTVQPHRPWLGWRRRHHFQLQPQLHQTDVYPPEQWIDVDVAPRIPFGVQCLAVLGVCMGTALGLAVIRNHRGPVTSVQFDGQATAVISGSDDQTIRRWQSSRDLRHVQALRDVDKAVRVVRYRPRNNDALAAGLENGQILFWDFLSERSPQSLLYQKDDRVFDLQFSLDSRSLFSGHGSGRVLQWDLSDLDHRNPLTTPVQQRKFDFAIQAIAAMGTHDRLNNRTDTVLAIGGRFNHLVLWDVERDRTQAIAYPVGSPNHYIMSLDVAEYPHTRMASADNQGRITLWNLSNCLTPNNFEINNFEINNFNADRTNTYGSSSSCVQTDQWSDGHQEQPVNAVALTRNGCYLASGGDDGRVMLWVLNAAGQVMEHRRLAQYSKPVNSVDITQRAQKLVVVSGNDTHQVRLHSTKATNSACP